MDKIKKYKLWYWIFLIIGIIGLTDIASFSIIQKNFYTYDMDGIGYLGLGQIYISRILFWGGNEITKLQSFFTYFFGTLIQMIDLSIIWLAFAFVLKRKTNAIESPTEKNLKKLKHLDAITVVAVATVIMFLVLVLIIDFDL